MAGFDDIVGQKNMVTHFENAIKMKKISHAYIINGETGMGKRRMAKAFAMTLQCEKKGIRPCMTCRSCKQALTDNHPDIRWITHEKPGVISVDEIRSQINSDVQIKPYGSEYKIYLINDASKMNTAAQNALLKTIEEPPEYVVILLLTDNKEALLSTILSRCVSMEMKPVEKEKIVDYLISEEKIVDYRAREVVEFAGGNIGKAIKLASSDAFLELKEGIVKTTKTVGRMTAADIMAAVKEASVYKDNISEYLDLLTLWYRDVLLYKACGRKDKLIFQEEEKYIIEQADKFSYGRIEKVLKEIDGFKAKNKVNVNFDILMELLFLKMRECFLGSF